ncbi:FlmC family 2OG-Fe(II) oxygenase [Pedobacter lusitanus]|uniref:2OG-Fe(II) oxygenase n=1 Tax=Pedobacter lusitanus TaxID=1503925 RepID=UPI000A76320A|nr:2OG-Fe(II) oxygenase [Pedobacter lusitanus]
MKYESFEINDKAIYIIDDEIEKDLVDNFYEQIQTLAFVKGEKDFDGDKYPIFSVDFDVEKFETSNLFAQKAAFLIERFYADHQYQMRRAYINLSNYGDVEFPHSDCREDENDLTVVYYVNKFWDYRWGGETIFYENHESKRCVLPKPGRFLIFPGAVEHLGSISTRICTESRLTMAIKYKQISS